MPKSLELKTNVNAESLSAEQLITDHIDIWTSAIEQKSSAGRGTSKKFSLYGIKKLRELILELAVRGKLVPQDVNDSSPQKALLKSIEKKENLIGSGVIKKSRSKKVIKDEHFYSYPKHWETARIEDLINVINGRAYKKHEMLSEGTPILRVGNLFTSNDWYYSDLDLDSDKYIDDGDLIYAWSASFGPFIWDGGKVIYHYHIWKMDLHSEIALDKSFSKLFLAAISERIKASGNGIAMIHMTKERMEKVIHPLPPLEEQHRIVAKVDELMLLCDALEAQTEASISAHQTLVETLLNALLLPNTTQQVPTNASNTLDDSLEPAFQNSDATSPEPSLAKSFDKAWLRIAEHFDTLFTTAASIDTLKQTILQLAVMGKLVTQDPHDEPVSKLLDRIIAHQTIRIKNKEIQKPKKVVGDEARLLMTPSSWRPILLNDLVFVTKLAGFEYSKYIKLEDSGEVPVIRAQNVRPFKPALENLKYVSRLTSDALPRSALDRPSLLVTFIGAGIGDVCVFDQEERWHLAPNVAKIEPYADLSLNYLCIYLNSTTGRTELFKSMKSTAQPSLSMTTIREIWVSLPPLEEQQRIVAKVEELMALCDKLKARLTDARTTQLHLTDAIVEQVTGNVINNKNEIQEKVPMKIITPLTTTSEFHGQSEALLAGIIRTLDDADAKSVWSKSGLTLPDFYKQLKKEIDAGFVNLPSKADFL